MNIFIGAGRLTRDVEILYTGTGKTIARFTIAISRPKSASGDKVTDFISCQAWDKTAEFMANYFRKGSGIMVEGQLNIDQATAEDGTRKQYTKINVSKVYFPPSNPQDAPLPDTYRKPEQAEPLQPAVDDNSDDVPFSN